MNETVEAKPDTRFAVFRAKHARTDVESTVLEMAPFTEVVANGATRAMAAGMDQGSMLKLLWEGAGFTLVHAWFKSDFPLPRHAHNCDCLYYIVAGSLIMGTEILGTGDGFFVGKDVPYSYKAGANGVEVLEFRATTRFDIKVLANNPLFWDQAVATAQQHRTTWTKEEPPSIASQTAEKAPLASST